jgi:hypothetical protein
MRDRIADLRSQIHEEKALAAEAFRQRKEEIRELEYKYHVRLCPVLSSFWVKVSFQASQQYFFFCSFCFFVETAFLLYSVTCSESLSNGG